MELHSYAKIRSYPYKKLTIEQKRKLIENRIILDELFNSKIFNIDDSWIKLIKVCDLNGFDIDFIKKQWKYTLLKYDHFLKRNNKTIQSLDDSTRDLFSNEWEFFKKIHLWLKYKEQHKKNKRNKNIIPLEIINIGLKNNPNADSSDTETEIASDNISSQAPILQSVSSSSITTKNNYLKLENPIKIKSKLNILDNKNENNKRNKFIKKENLQKLKNKKKLLENKLEMCKLKFSILRMKKKLNNINNSLKNYPTLDMKSIQSSSSSSNSSELDSDSSST